MSETNLYRRGETWWLRASINNIPIRESLHTSDVKAARKIRDKRLAAIKAAAWGDGSANPAKKISWLNAVTAFADHKADQIAATTARRYASSLIQCEPFLKLIDDVAAIDGQLIGALIESRRKTGIKLATIRRDLTAVSQVLEFCEDRGWREGNPARAKSGRLKERRDPIVLPNIDDVRGFVASCPARFGALTWAALLTGCRQNELVTATWTAFNARAQTLEVIGKRNKRRTIALSEAAALHLQSQPRTLGSELIFCREDGLPISMAASDFHRHRKQYEATKPAGYRQFRFHDLRHFYAVLELRSGRGLYDLSKHLGHTSVTMTEWYCTFLTPAEEAAAKANSIVLGTKVGTATRR